jgi:O-acetyl-ADP-ribose deacetylase (regulator of RNase III)
LGTWHLVTVEKEKHVANLFGQYDYGRGKQYTDYESLRSALFGLVKIAEEFNKSIAIPYGIGCGLAGGDWKEIYKIIEEVFEDYDVTIYKL